MKALIPALVLIGSAALFAEAPTERTTMIARGSFEVEFTPQSDDAAQSGPFQRVLLGKKFTGDFEGTGRGQMLGARSADQTSGAYVAMEILEGSLAGKRGSFMLHHNGTMQGPEMKMEISVVPDSGTDELAGIVGTFKIIMAEGRHDYEFEYRLP